MMLYKLVRQVVYLLLSCSICWTEPDLRRPSGVAAVVGRCQVVDRLM